MADIANPTGHVATYNDLLTTIAADGDVYIVDDTQEAYQFSGVTVTWTALGPVSSTEPTPPPTTESPPATEPPPPDAPTQYGGTIGAAVPGTTTLDALVTAAFSNKSADLAGAISYFWYTPTRVIGTWPSATSNTGKNASCVRVILEPQTHAPSSLLP